MTRALLLDLDDTLVVEEPAAVAAFAATARAAAERHALDPRQLALDARACARELWRAAEVCAFGRRIGISSWEALWCRYEGDGEELRAMRAWAPGYRRETWRAALGRPGGAGRRAGGRAGRALRRGAPRAPRDLRGRRPGPRRAARRLPPRARDQRRVVPAAREVRGLGPRRPLRRGRRLRRAAPPSPTRRSSRTRCGRSAPSRATPSWSATASHKDVDGALAAGLGAVWLNRDGKPRPEDRTDLVEIAGLAELPAALA